MFLRPATFNGFLSQNNHIDEIYDALMKNDTANLVITVLHILKKTNTIPAVANNNKNEFQSRKYRVEGNDAFQTGNYQKALELYNQALLFAPINTREMKLAYSNRSALFCKLHVWTACYNDIQRCFAMGCPSDILEKLTKRKNEVLPNLPMDNLPKMLFEKVVQKCISLNPITCNSEIPSASLDVKIDTSRTEPKVVASSDINVGTVVASERAYVSYTSIENALISCHFCQKKTLDLIPCDGCCYALFCDEQCKNKCIEEYHKYECKIMDAIKVVCCGAMPILMVKACLKFKSSCKSWKELITASYNMGIDRVKSSCNKEIYDTNNKYSILCFDDDRTFIHGVMYNASFVCAAMLHYLDDKVPLFAPKDAVEKQEAMKALARIMMFLSVYQKPFLIIQSQTIIKLDKTNYGFPNFGLFPFFAKFNNSCNSNLLIMNNNNKLVLVASRLIKKGEKLIVPYLYPSHGCFIPKQVQNIRTFLYKGTVCSCEHCNNSVINAEPLSEYQKKYFSELNRKEIQSKLKSLKFASVYPTIVNALAVLSNVPNSDEYIEIVTYFKQCVFFFECASTDNNLLDCTL